MFTKRFWRFALERAIKTMAQAMILALGVGQVAPEQVNAWMVQWDVVAGFGVGGFVLSILTSLATGKVGPDKDAPTVVGDTDG